MSDKRSVSTDALETLGTIIDEHAGRDAIHVAVEPVRAGEWLSPGQDVGLVDGVAMHHTKNEAVGIVDPFLVHDVKPGQWFWLLVYPRTITSLRHVWSHPAFEEKEPVAVAAPDKAVSEAWLRDFCNRSDCPGYEAVLALAIENKDSDDDYLHFDGRDAHGEIPSEFWIHMEIVTGMKFRNRATYFSCSC